jgi:hypothetical protein
MEIRDELALLAEIGIAFAGFLAIFLVFAERGDRFSSSDRDQMLTVVVIGFAVMFAALTPLVLDRLGLEPPFIWRAASAVAVCIAIAPAVYFNLPERRRRAAEEPPSMQRTIVALYVLPTSALVIIPLYLGIVFGVFVAAAPGVYLLVNVVALAAGATSFLSLVIDRFS